MRADLLELANVGGLFLFSGEEGPDFGDLVALHIKHTSAFRRIEPLVQTGAEVVAVQILLLKIELGERMRPVDDRFNAACARHFADGSDGRNLSGDVDLVRNLKQAR